MAKSRMSMKNRYGKVCLGCAMVGMAVHAMHVARWAWQYIAWVCHNRRDSALHGCGKIAMTVFGMGVAR